jgi:hypothetical protein
MSAPLDQGSERQTTVPDELSGVCPHCNGVRWRRSVLGPALVALIAVLLAAAGVWLVYFGATGSRGMLRIFLGFGLVTVYFAALTFIAAWKGRWRLCQCASGRRGWLYDG